MLNSMRVRLIIKLLFHHCKYRKSTCMYFKRYIYYTTLTCNSGWLGVKYPCTYTDDGHLLHALLIRTFILANSKTVSNGLPYVMLDTLK